jgi:hypothetical protein
VFGLHGTSASDWVLPVLIVAAWLVLWIVRRRIGGGFFALTGVLAGLCFPVGVALGAVGDECPRPAPPGCIAPYEWTLWMNGILAFCAVIGLLILTVPVWLAQFQLRHARRSASDSPGGRGSAG